VSACLLSEVRIAPAGGPQDIEAARRLFRAYATWLAVDLCFQGFEEEVATLPGLYAPPAGCLLLARAGDAVAGCVGLRPLEPGIGEMKRLWVEPGFAGAGLGRALAERVIAEARAIGYGAIRLDTIPARMPAAQHLYGSLGFREIPAYYANPLEGVVMLELTLWPGSPEQERERRGCSGVA
jgi:putative acetyltransferase